MRKICGSAMAAEVFIINAGSGLHFSDGGG
jgi:hypothetical protein